MAHGDQRRWLGAGDLRGEALGARDRGDATLRALGALRLGVAKNLRGVARAHAVIGVRGTRDGSTGDGEA